MTSFGHYSPNNECHAVSYELTTHAGPTAITLGFTQYHVSMCPLSLRSILHVT